MGTIYEGESKGAVQTLGRGEDSWEAIGDKVAPEAGGVVRDCSLQGGRKREVGKLEQKVSGVTWVGKGKNR